MLQDDNLTWPCLVWSWAQSGTIFDSLTIQLFILSRRRLSTAILFEN